MTHIHACVVLCTLFLVTAGGSASAATVCVDAKPKPGCYLTITAGIGRCPTRRYGANRATIFMSKLSSNSLCRWLGFGPSTQSSTRRATTMELAFTLTAWTTQHSGYYRWKPLRPERCCCARVYGYQCEIRGDSFSNASNVTVVENHVTGNNTILDAQNQLCSGLPDWETSEGFDCGEGIHLVAVDHSLVANNRVDHNAGGILLTDETGPNHDNQIVENTVTENPIDCGITLASHKPAPNYALTPYSVFHNTIAFNELTRNGVGALGNGVGIEPLRPAGMQTPPPIVML